MKKILKGFIVFSVVYTLLTIISSSLQLAQGVRQDSNLHLLARAIITFIPIFTYFVLDLGAKCGRTATVAKVAAHYALCLGAAFLTVFLLGFEDTLSKNAYRDIFLNFTGAYLVVAAVFAIVLTQLHKKRGSSRA